MYLKKILSIVRGGQLYGSLDNDPWRKAKFAKMMTIIIVANALDPSTEEEAEADEAARKKRPVTSRAISAYVR